MERGGLLTVRLEGPAVEGGRVAVRDLVTIATHVQAAVRRIALVLLGERPGRPGRRPADIDRLTELDVVALSPGSVELSLDLRGAQLQLPEMDLGRRAAQLLVDGVACLKQGGGLPPGWDASVAMAVRETAQLFRRGIHRVGFAVRLDDTRRSASLEPADVERLERALTGPLSARRTVEGRLLMADFAEPRTRCRIHPPLGPAVECTFDDARRQAVLAALTKYVRVTGDAELEPETGRIRRLAITDIEVVDWEVPGEPVVPFWEDVSLEELARAQGVAPVTSLEDLAADIWESREELEEFLADTYAARRADLSR